MSVCSHCGAPLRLGFGVGRCNYCGRDVVATASGAPARSTRSSPVVLLVTLSLGMVGLMAVAAVVLIVLSTRDSSTPPPRPATAPTPRRARPPDFRGPACPIDDVTGDGIGDYAAMVGADAGRHRVVRVNGADGEVLTASGEGTFYPVSHTSPFCPATGWYGVAVDETMSVELFSGEMLIPAHRISLSSEPDELGRGDGCIRVTARNRRETDVSLRTGQPTDCPSGLGNFGRGLTGHQQVPDRFQSVRDPWEVCEGGRCYRLALGQADRYIRLTATEGAEERWTTQLRFMQPSTGHAAAVAGSVLVVVGARRHSEGGGLFAMGIDTETGRERWASQIGHDRIQMLHYNGRHAVVSQRVMLALDPLSGEEAWRLGR